MFTIVKKKKPKDFLEVHRLSEQFKIRHEVKEIICECLEEDPVKRITLSYWHKKWAPIFHDWKDLEGTRV